MEDLPGRPLDEELSADEVNPRPHRVSLSRPGYRLPVRFREEVSEFVQEEEEDSVGVGAVKVGLGPMHLPEEAYNEFTE